VWFLETRVLWVVSYRSPPSPPSSPPPSSFFRGGLWFGNGARVSGLTLIGARVVGGGGIGAGGSLATVLGGWTEGCGG